MSVKKNRKKRMSVLFARSKILEFFVTIASFLYSKAECSLAGKMFTSYNTNYAEDSMICRLFGRLNLGKKFFRPVKRNISKLVSQSFLLEKINGYFKGWLYTKLSVYGLFSITSGIGFVLLQLLKVYGMGIGKLSFLDMFISLMLIAVSIPLIISHASLNEAVCESKSARWLLFEWLGCKKEAFEQQSLQKSHTRTALPLGVIFCVLSWWVRPIILFAFIGVIVLALTIFYIPETGIVSLVFLLPFLSARRLSMLIVYITVCFLMKYIRGKRTVKFDPMATAVLAFSLLMLPNTQRFWQGLLGVCIFFLVINLIKSKKWISRTLTSLVFSFFLSVFYGLASYISAKLGIDYLTFVFRATDDMGMQSLFGSAEIFASYIVTVLPLIAVAKNKKANSVISFFAVIAGVVCLFLTREYRAWISILFGVVLFFVFYGKKTLAFIGIMLCTLPVVFINLPKSFFERMFDSSITDHLHEALFGDVNGHIDIFYILAVFLFALVLLLCLQKSITFFSDGCSIEGRKVSLGAMAGVTAFIVMGQNIVIAADFKLLLIFWLLLGLASCVCETERSNAVYNEYDKFDYSEGDLY